MAEHADHYSIYNSNRRYQYYNPLAQSNDKVSHLPIDIVEKITQMKTALEDNDRYTLKFIKDIFEPEEEKITELIKQHNINNRGPYRIHFFNFSNLGLHPKIVINLEIKNKLRWHVINLYSSTFFIKDFTYLIEKFKLDADKLKDSSVQIRSVVGWHGRSIDFEETEHAYQTRVIKKFFDDNLKAAYSMYIVIENVVKKIERYVKHKRVDIYPVSEAERVLQDRYLVAPDNPFRDGDENQPIEVLKLYIKALNKVLLSLREYKIQLNPRIVESLNRTLDKLNTHLVTYESESTYQANAKFDERIDVITLAGSKKTKSKKTKSKSKSKTRTKRRKYFK